MRQQLGDTRTPPRPRNTTTPRPRGEAEPPHLKPTPTARWTTATRGEVRDQKSGPRRVKQWCARLVVASGRRRGRWRRQQGVALATADRGRAHQRNAISGTARRWRPERGRREIVGDGNTESPATATSPATTHDNTARHSVTWMRRELGRGQTVDNSRSSQTPKHDNSVEVEDALHDNAIQDGVTTTSTARLSTNTRKRQQRPISTTRSTTTTCRPTTPTTRTRTTRSTTRVTPTSMSRSRSRTPSRTTTRRSRTTSWSSRRTRATSRSTNRHQGRLAQSLS